MNKKHSGFLMQATVLAAAGIIVRIIGLLYRSPMNSIIGDEGMGYYGYAYNIYTLILMISSYSVPMAVSKIISERLVLKEYKNANRIFKAALAYVIVIGGLASIVAFIFAPQLASPNSALALRVLTPTIFFSGILGVFRGYFQAHRTMAPTSFSQILEQVVHAIVSVLAAWVFIKIFASGDAARAPIVGAAGGALGTGLGVLAGLAFMAFGYYAMRPSMERRMRGDTTSEVESYSKVFRILILMVTPIIFSTCINNISVTIDMKLFQTMMNSTGMAKEATAALYGVFSNKYVPLMNVPIALASAMATAMMPEISASFAKRNYPEMKNKISQSVRFTMMIALPAAVGMAVLSRPIIQLLFPQKETIQVAANLLTLGAITIVLTTISTLTIAVLQGTGNVIIPVKHAAISLICDVVLLLLLLKFTKLGVYALVLATILNTAVMCILNARSVKNIVGYRQKIGNAFVIPAIAATVMGLVAWASYASVHALLGSNLVSLLIAILLASAVYFIIVLKLGGVTERDLQHFPKGNLLTKVAKKCHLI